MLGASVNYENPHGHSSNRSCVKYAGSRMDLGAMFFAKLSPSPSQSWAELVILSENPATHPASQPAGFSMIGQYITNKSLYTVLEGSETCFGMSLGPMLIPCQPN